MARTQNAASNPLPPKLAGLLKESWWFVFIAVALYLVLILLTYSKADPGWSHSIEPEKIGNAGGRFGAWLADVLLYVFGMSAYWWVVFCLFLVFWGYRQLERTELGDRRSIIVSGAGFLLLLIASCGMEALRLYKLKAALPLGPGGIIGSLVSSGLDAALGFTGATLVLLVSVAVGLSLFIQVSWIDAIERFGGWLEGAWFYSVGRIMAWRDRKVGEVAAVEREVTVEKVRKRLEPHEPIRIEPPVVEIPKSERVVREKQRPLFEDIPDSPLPPLHLLDEPEEDVEVVSAEALEYTSRLIEKKLLDFGVEVKVLAAYPGPVITRYEVEPAVGVKGSQIINLVKDLARALSVVSIRVVETIPGKSCMGLEIPNPKRQIVRLSEILSSKVYADMSSPL
ncbi:MAG: DNA translocase FtsK 4TM domain-containing protein, partial [Nitrospira sp.]|nr:DNA translocase FtsK 4TM domain-containing protein [Nitrospira sp.]